jgi:glycerate kinase
MRILVAPNSMKGSLDAFDFANAIEAGLNLAGISEIIKLPIADGGDGTAKVLSTYYNNCRFIPVRVSDPLGRAIESGFYFDILGTAIIEMADASGLKLLTPSEYSATLTTSYGTGQLIAAAFDVGAKTIILGLGGSATVDGGMGALMALGVKFYCSEGEICNGNGENMGNVLLIDAAPAIQRLKGLRLVLLSDVESPLLGKKGAVDVYGPQKGATATEVKMLEKNLSLFAGALFQTTGIDCSALPGGGAAGGIAASFHCLLGAELHNGASFILDKASFRSIAGNADVIITGEGKIDETTLRGKAPGEVLKIGMVIDKPVYAICGSNGLQAKCGFAEIVSLQTNSIDEASSIKNAKALVEERSKNLGLKLKENYG